MPEKKTALLYYFAYGSNMAVERLQARVPSAKRVVTARLTGHALRFHKKGMDGSGKCDVVSTGNPADCVHGIVFEIATAEKPALDRAEGPRYVQQHVQLVLTDGSPVDAFLYVVADKGRFTDAAIKPFCWYKYHVLYGARSNGLPGDYIARIEAELEQPDRDEQRRIHEMRVYVKNAASGP
ncbi:AIG2 family protein [Nitrosococcus watsonii C-113]|uniref:AIG2 family protein n=2 Tax=Nitrosococcus TaxID=1227 RepID=D8KBB4_NITWC|nr:AIG2 family protein [Nitrosococcus watsonii C-113]